MLTQSTALVLTPGEHVLGQAYIYQKEKRFTFACFGKKFGTRTDVNWSLRPLQRAGDAEKNPELSMQLEAVFDAFGAERIYAPSPVDCNARYVSPALLKQEIPIGNALLCRDKDVPADVCDLVVGEAGAFSAGGCPLIVATRGTMLLFAHAGRWSLIDPDRVRKDKPPGQWRFKESVVGTILDQLRVGHGNPDVRVWVYGALHPRRYPHPLDGPYGDFNGKMRTYALNEWGAAAAEAMPIENRVIYLDLPMLIRAQFERFGISREHINISRGYLNDESKVWLDGAQGRPRNLFLVHRHS